MRDFFALDYLSFMTSQCNSFNTETFSGSEICQQGTRQSPVDVSFNRTVPYCDAGDIGTVMKWGSLVPNLAWHVWDAGDHCKGEVGEGKKGKERGK